MRILLAIGVGLMTGLVSVIAYVWIVGTIVSRSQSPPPAMVAVGGVPVLIVFVIGFGVGFFLMMRR